MEQGYITVAERLAAFVEKYPDGQIETSLVSITDVMAVVAAKVWKGKREGFDTPPDGTGLSSMPIPGPTNFTRGSEVENAETSAIGRALAAIGFLAKNPDGSARISSNDEIRAKNADADEESEFKVSPKQRGLIFKLVTEAGIDKDTAKGKALLKKITKEATGKMSLKQLSSNEDVDNLIAALKAKAVEKLADVDDDDEDDD
jgi:hypothetical protein